MEYSTNISDLIIRVAPNLVFYNFIMRHGFSFSSELEVKFTGSYSSYRGSCRRISLKRYIRSGILSSASPSIEQSHTVDYKPVSVSCSTSLHCFQVRILNVHYLSILINLHAKSFRVNVFIQSVQIINTFTKLIALLFVKHLEDVVIGKFTTQSDICRF